MKRKISIVEISKDESRIVYENGDVITMRAGDVMRINGKEGEIVNGELIEKRHHEEASEV